MKRFLKFFDTVLKTDSPHLKILHFYQSKDNRSVYGRNIMNILRDTNVNCRSEVDLSKVMINPVPVGHEWRIPLLKDLIQERDNPSGFLSRNEIQNIMDHICID